jgi:hypothetical protein
MNYEGLETDFNNIRQTQPYVVGKVIDEAQNYIEYLEGKEDVLNKVVEYLNELDVSTKNETKKEILDHLLTILPSE